MKRKEDFYIELCYQINKIKKINKMLVEFSRLKNMDLKYEITNLLWQQNPKKYDYEDTIIMICWMISD